MQDEGSQLLALLTDAKRGEMVVDFCAGAGGKTLALGAAMRNTGRLYAFDVSGPPARRAEAAAGAQRPVQRAPGADRARARRAHQAPGRQDRPRAGRCAVLGPGHAAPQPGPEVAPVAQGGAGTAASSRRRSWPARRACSSPAAGWSMPPAACCAQRKRGRCRRLRSGASREFAPLAVERAAWRGAQVAGAETLVHAGHLRLWPHRHGTDGFFAAVWQRR